MANCTLGNILYFAVVACMYLSDCNLDNLFANAYLEVNKLFNWFCENTLSLNPTKTTFVFIRNSNNYVNSNSTEQKRYIYGIPVTQIRSDFHEKSTTFLGLQLVNVLSWKSLLVQINKRISCALFITLQINNFMLINSLKTLYYARINPHVSREILA